MKKYLYLIVGLVTLLALLGLYLYGFGSHLTGYPLLQGKNIPTSCTQNVYGMMSGNSTMMGRRPMMGGYVSEPFVDRQVVIGDYYYSYMGNWNYWRMSYFYKSSWMRGYNMMYTNNQNGGYDLYVRCGQENLLFP